MEDDEDLRVAGLEGTDAEPVTVGDDGKEDRADARRAALLAEARGRRLGELIVASRCGGKSDRVSDFSTLSVHRILHRKITLLLQLV